MSCLGRLGNQQIEARFPTKGAKVLHALAYKKSHLGKTAKLVVELPDGKVESYFLKVPLIGEIGQKMCKGEYESLKAIYEVSPGFVPKPYYWGEYDKNTQSYFLLEEFRDIGKQPADPITLATKLADLHKHSKSPTGKFGFHVKTCHGRIEQQVDQWDESWAALFHRHLGHIISLAKSTFNWQKFDIVSDLTLEKVVPRLLLPLQENGRVLKPSLIHGDCWDGNTALDGATGEAFVFDACSFYGHNEYDTGNWRASRHLLSGKKYMECYKETFPVSEPVEDWDARNLLYSLPFNLENAMYIPGSDQRQVVYEEMMTLCKMFCPGDLETAMSGGIKKGEVKAREWR
ncbi:hypothetical protein HYFRA_00004562 [Hymenoscyphus fraxineus]|uniref:protein-ribulosamine 3-kinase n=1 Tax=Hymenoscyphus fraxineus TaxID=746836 RepID=A0A9N9L067_9HELO|nr:hypothetical protein HYFRA_00004562 [Hymenoscyphus fraxineus]